MRKLLVPASWIYGMMVSARNFLYDRQIKKSVEFDLPVISIGNLSAGGTGKTPHIEYLIRTFHDQFRVGTLSRGYGRRTKGYRLAETTDNARDTGDEPLQIKRNFPQVTVAVCEERAIGIPIMLLDDPSLQIILLDDAFQHRQVKHGLNLLLTDYSKPFTRDYLLPAGNLREPVQNASRADAIVITKVPANASAASVMAMKKEVQMSANQKVFASTLNYGLMYLMWDASKMAHDVSKLHILLLTGIASSHALAEYLKSKVTKLTELMFADHHPYSMRDIRKIITAYRSLPAESRMIVTTEKDAVRLLPFKDQLLNEGVEIYCIPVEVKFEAEEKSAFDDFVRNFIVKTLQSRNNE